MKDFLTWLIKAIVDKPEEVKVNESESNGQIVLDLHVDKDDMGRVIGKAGKIIKGIRSLLKARALKEDKRVFVNLVEDEN